MGLFSRKESRWTLSAPPAFSDLVEARFRMQRDGVGNEGPVFARYQSMRDEFELAEGKIQREYWGRHLPIGVVLTERPRGWVRRWFRRAPTMHIHHTASYLERMPIDFHTSVHLGDVLTVRAGWSLGDLSRHTVIDRIFDGQVFLFTIADNVEGVVTGRDDSILPQPQAGARG